MTTQSNLFPGEPPRRPYALTLWQPWAGVVASGMKLIENRPWCAPKWIRGERIYIHAGKHYSQDAEDYITEALEDDEFMPKAASVLGALLGSARVVGCVHCIDDVDPGERRWFFGPHGWVLDGVRLLSEPVPCRGFQKLWRVPPDIAGVLGVGR